MPADVTNMSKNVSGLIQPFISNSCTCLMLLLVVGGWLSSIFKDSASVPLWFCHLLGLWSTLFAAKGRGKNREWMHTYLSTVSWKWHNCSCSYYIGENESHDPTQTGRKGSTNLDVQLAVFPLFIPLTIEHLWINFLHIKRTQYLFKEVHSELYSVTPSRKLSVQKIWGIHNLLLQVWVWPLMVQWLCLFPEIGGIFGPNLDHSLYIHLLPCNFTAVSICCGWNAVPTLGRWA